MKKYAMFIGRWQTWHKGHEWLINQQLTKGKNVWVAIRNVEVDENNPKSAQQVLQELQQEPFFTNNWDKIMLSIIPDIESVNYGRAVGYEVIYHEPPKEIEQISGTAIRQKYIDSNGDVIVYNIEKDDSREETTHS
jgi:nicotinamide mononucleotide adenylyltransferase